MLVSLDSIDQSRPRRDRRVDFRRTPTLGESNSWLRLESRSLMGLFSHGAQFGLPFAQPTANAGSNIFGLAQSNIVAGVAESDFTNSRVEPDGVSTLSIQFSSISSTTLESPSPDPTSYTNQVYVTSSHLNTQRIDATGIVFHDGFTEGPPTFQGSGATSNGPLNWVISQPGGGNLQGGGVQIDLNLTVSTPTQNRIGQMATLNIATNFVTVTTEIGSSSLTITDTQTGDTLLGPVSIGRGANIQFSTVYPYPANSTSLPVTMSYSSSLINWWTGTFSDETVLDQSGMAYTFAMTALS